MPHLFRFRSWLSLTKLVSCITLAQAAFLHELSGEQPRVSAAANLTQLAEPPLWQALQKYNGVLTKEEFISALDQVYHQVEPPHYPWKWDDEALILDTGLGRPPMEIKFRTAETQSTLPHQSLRYWRGAKELPVLKEDEPVLKGLNIALDAGHIGGEWSKMEERHLSMNEGEAVKEGDLMLELAKILKPRLEALGAIVTLVRSELQPVTQSRPEDYLIEAEKGLVQRGIHTPLRDYTADMGEQKQFTVRWQAERLFYRVAEIRDRAKKVNDQIRPDIVLALHLNAEAWGDPKNPVLTPKNHYHILVNGAYSPSELRHEDVRFDMLQRVYQKISPEETALANALAKALGEQTQLPGYTYTSPNARAVEGGEYTWARNLLANRLYQCPVVYYEPYIMNHEQTYHDLLLGHFVGETRHRGTWVKSPIENYARAVVNGLKRYYGTHRRVAKPVDP